MFSQSITYKTFLYNKISHSTVKSKNTCAATKLLQVILGAVTDIVGMTLVGLMVLVQYSTAKKSIAINA